MLPIMENEICRRYTEGESSTKIGKSLGINPSYICQILNHNKIEIRYKQMAVTKELDMMIPQMEKMFKEGNKIVTIAKELNVGPKEVSRRLKKLGYEIRKISHSKEFLMKHSEEIVQMYRSGMSTIEIGKKFDCVASSIWRVLKDNNEATKPVRVNSVNHDFFDKIDNEVKAYCFGFFLADGNTSTKGTISKITLIDEDILLEMAKQMQFNGKIYRNKPKGNRTQAHTLQIASPKLREDLIKHGCVPNKTFILERPKTISKDLYRHIIRGYMDGDGSINRYECEKWRIYDRWNVNFVGTEDFMKWIMEVINENQICLGVNRLYKKCKDNEKNTWLLYIKSYHCIPFLNWLYQDATIFLKRKHQKYLDMVEHYKSKGLVINPGEPDGDYYFNVPQNKFIKRD